MNKNNITCALSSDFFKLRKLKSVWIALIIMFCLILISYAAYWIGVQTIDSLDWSDIDEIDGLEAKAQMLDTLQKLKDTLLFGSTSTASIEFLMAIIVCIYIGKDFSSGAVALSTARGTKRREMYFSKWIMCVCLFVAYSIFALIVSGIFRTFDGESALATGEFAMLMRNFALQLLCGIATISIFVMIAFLARSSGSSIAITIGAYVLLNIVISIIATIVTSPDASEEWTYFFPLQQMNIACTYGKFTTAQTVAVIVMPIAYTALSTFIGYFTFEKRDIK